MPRPRSGILKGYFFAHCPQCKKETSQKAIPNGRWCNNHKGKVNDA